MNDEESTFKQNPAFVHADLKRRQAVNKDLFSASEKASAAEMRDLLDEAYFGATVYSPNYRETFIAIKIQNPGQARMRGEVIAINTRLEKAGVEIKRMKNGNVVYRLPREEDDA